MKKRWGIGLAVCGLVLGGLGWHAAQHRSTGPAAGTQIGGEGFLQSTCGENGPHPNPLPEGEGGRTATSFRIATWNIHGGKGTDGQRDMGRIAKMLQGFDFVALQEVHGPGIFDRADQAEILGNQLKMARLFAPAVRQWYCCQSGNGLLSKMPVAFWQRIPLPRQRDYSYRNMILCGIKPRGFQSPGRFIRILITHVNRRHDVERKAQLRTVIAMFLSLQEPAVLLGDLNSTPQDPQITQLLETDGVLDPVGKILGPKAPERIDWILVRGLKCHGAGIEETEASDHPLVWAELEISCN